MQSASSSRAANGKTGNAEARREEESPGRRGHDATRLRSRGSRGRGEGHGRQASRAREQFAAAGYRNVQQHAVLARKSGKYRAWPSPRFKRIVSPGRTCVTDALRQLAAEVQGKAFGATEYVVNVAGQAG